MNMQLDGNEADSGEDFEDLRAEDLEPVACSQGDDVEDDDWFYPDEWERAPGRPAASAGDGVPQPVHRVVEIGRNHHAVFDGPGPCAKIFVYKIEASQPIELPYFDPTNMSDADLMLTIRKYLKFI